MIVMLLQILFNTWAADEVNVDKTIVVNFVDDVIDEGDEVITVTLSGVSGGAAEGSTIVHTITLRDSDIPPTMQFTNSTMTVNESGSNITIPLTLRMMVQYETSIRFWRC